MNDKRKRKPPQLDTYSVAYVEGLEKRIKELENQVAKYYEVIQQLAGPQAAPTISETNKQ